MWDAYIKLQTLPASSSSSSSTVENVRTEGLVDFFNRRTNVAEPLTMKQMYEQYKEMFEVLTVMEITPTEDAKLANSNTYADFLKKFRGDHTEAVRMNEELIFRFETDKKLFYKTLFNIEGADGEDKIKDWFYNHFKNMLQKMCEFIRTWINALNLYIVSHRREEDGLAVSEYKSMVENIIKAASSDDINSWKSISVNVAQSFSEFNKSSDRTIKDYLKKMVDFAKQIDTLYNCLTSIFADENNIVNKFHDIFFKVEAKDDNYTQLTEKYAEIKFTDQQSDVKNYVTIIRILKERTDVFNKIITFIGKQSAEQFGASNVKSLSNLKENLASHRFWLMAGFTVTVCATAFFLRSSGMNTIAAVLFFDGVPAIVTRMWTAIKKLGGRKSFKNELTIESISVVVTLTDGEKKNVRETLDVCSTQITNFAFKYDKGNFLTANQAIQRGFLCINQMTSTKDHGEINKFIVSLEKMLAMTGLETYLSDTTRRIVAKNIRKLKAVLVRVNFSESYTMTCFLLRTTN